MTTSMEWHGLKELREELRRLPEDSRAEAEKVVEGHVNAAYVTIKRVYEAHRVTGTLSTRLSISPLTTRGVMTTGLTLRSGSPLAWLFDHGSEARHYVSVHGVKHLLGRMPARPVFSRTVGFTKRQIRQALTDMLRRRGAQTVTGE
jgi:hypothetical protein